MREQFGEKVTLTGRKVKLSTYKQTVSQNVGVGTSKQIIITPSTGFIGRVKSIGFYSAAVPTATTGAHNIGISIGSTLGINAEYLVYTSAAYNATLNYMASSGGFPSVGALFDSINPLTINYNNTTDKAQTTPLYLVVTWEEEAVI